MSVHEGVSYPKNVCNVTTQQGYLVPKMCVMSMHEGVLNPYTSSQNYLTEKRWKLWNVLSCPKSVLFNSKKTSPRRDERQEMSKSVGQQQKPRTGGGKRYKRRWMWEVSCLLDRVWNILGLWEGFTSHPSTCLIKIHVDTQKVQNVFKSVTRPHDPPKKMPDLSDIQMGWNVSSVQEDV